jgi:hypothetical protein
MFAVCSDKYCSINEVHSRLHTGLLINENMRKERAMLAQANTNTKVPLSDCTGKQNKSHGFDGPVAKVKKKLTVISAAQREIAKLKNQLQQDNNAKVPKEFAK